MRSPAPLALALAPWIAACGDAPPAPAPPAARASAPTADVLGPRLAAAAPAPDLAAALAGGPAAGEEAELLEFARGMSALAASDPGAADLARRDVEAEGPAVVVPLLRVALDDALPDDERRAALDLLAATGEPDAARALAYVATVAGAAVDGPLGATGPEGAWLRRHAAWAARRLTDVPGADAAVPALLKRLKYEPDDEARVWLAGTLADLGNLAGLDALAAVAAGGGPAAPAATAEAARVIEAQGAADLDALLEAWRAGAARREPPPGDAARDELWRLVSDLSGEHFQLRGVDDARFVLARHGAWAAAELARALGDGDPFVRLHVCQALERMGPRARGGATEALTQRLDDPSAAVSAAAAEALGAVVAGAPDAEREAAADALAERAVPGVPHELRVAALRALGRLGRPADDERLLALARDDGAPVDLRMAAAEGLVARGRGRATAPFLVAQLDDPIGDAGTAEALLGRWLAAERGQRPASDDPVAVVHDAWTALAPPAERVHRPDEVRARRAARAALVTTLLPRLADVN